MKDIKGLDEKRLIKAFHLDSAEIFKINTMPEFKEDLLALLDDLEYYKKANVKLKAGFIPVRDRVQPKIKPIEMKNIKTGEKVIFESAFHAAKKTGFKQSDILAMSRLRKHKINDFEWRRIEGYKVCVECGFFGKKKTNFPQNGTQNGKMCYKKLCKKCYNKKSRLTGKR
jgi:hypothetical protein